MFNDIINIRIGKKHIVINEFWDIKVFHNTWWDDHPYPKFIQVYTWLGRQLA